MEEGTFVGENQRLTQIGTSPKGVFQICAPGLQSGSTREIPPPSLDFEGSNDEAFQLL